MPCQPCGVNGYKENVQWGICGEYSWEYSQGMRDLDETFLSRLFGKNDAVSYLTVGVDEDTSEIIKKENMKNAMIGTAFILLSNQNQGNRWMQNNS